MSKILPTLVLGAGGHARVLIDALQLNGYNIMGLVDNDVDKTGGSILGIPVIGSDAIIYNYPAVEVQLVNGLGSINSTVMRERLFRTFKTRGYQFISIIHPSATVARNVQLHEGIQVMAGAVIQTDSYIGENSVINTKVSIDHECMIGSHVHIAPGATLSGGVQVKDGVHIGTGATIIQGVKIGQGSLIAAGAVVVRDVPPGVTVMGVPGKVVQ